MQWREVAGRNRDDLKEWRVVMIGFSGTIHGHLNYMPVMYDGEGIYRSIIDGTEARVKPLPKDIFK
jgi:hypothetical protein